MWIWILTGLAVVFILYCFLPNLYSRNLSPFVLRKGSGEERKIALTFDDGPNPRYTPRVLDILKDYQVPAGFFLVGERAARHPELVRRMLQEGHTVGIHSYSHRHAWLMPPGTTYRDMGKSHRILSQIAGQAPRWYRPPWGTFNLMTLPAARKLKLIPVYWSIEAQDWEEWATPEHIHDAVMDLAKPGSISVLQDSGGAPGAPEKTIAALPLIIEDLKKQGFQFTTLDRMKGASPC